ncbi:MAG: hypothetical protein LQ337_006438 [Flavoplaca oasis]|nr:MAG: hypothetical protein LQ337_006438 [Flavoplaca oasis]
MKTLYTLTLFRSHTSTGTDNAIKGASSGLVGTSASTGQRPDRVTSNKIGSRNKAELADNKAGSMQIQNWQATAKAKVADIHSSIPKEWRLSDEDLGKAGQQRTLSGPFIEQYLTDKEKEIIRHDSLQIVGKIKSRDYTAVDVTRAYCKTAAVAQQINNCLHEIMFDFAFQAAKDLDDYYSKNGSVKGPLHGLPISLKDQFHVKGCDTTMGYVGWIGTYEGSRDPAKVHKINSQLVEELLSLGAVLYCKLGETVNNIIGTTLNPVNQLLSCGGSSGGEGALQALQGSSVGFGTDIGGSNPGQDTHASSIGAMGTSLDATKLVMTSVLSTSPWLRDPNVVKMPWNSEVESSTLARATADGSATSLPLKFGMYWTDGVVTPHPPIQRGLRIVRALLQALKHKVVDWSPPSHTTANDIHLAFLGADGAHDVHKQLDLSGEPLIPQLREGFKLREPMPLLEYQDKTLQGKAYNEAYSDYWNASSNDDGQTVDAILMPVAPHAAVIPRKYYHITYTESINLLDYSAAVIPVTRADKSVDKFDYDYRPLNEVDRKNWKAYDPETYDGAPVGLQIVARKWEEEKVWAIAKIIDSALKNRREKGP